MFVDLHTHTTYSDGLLTPTALIAYAERISLCAIAITDHDTVDGVQEAVQAAEAIEVIPGVELSTSEGPTDIHILGYYIDPMHEGLLRKLREFRDGRYLRAQCIVEKLNQLGVPITLEQVLTKADAGCIGRPHIADVLVEDGVVSSLEKAFRHYLGHHAPAYVPKVKISAKDAIHLIRSAGGVAVLAHPGTVRRDELIPSLVAVGLDGIEAIHPNHGEAVVRYYMKLAQKHDLIVTGGTDYHRPRGDRSDLGALHIPYDCVLALRSRLERALV